MKLAYLISAHTDATHLKRLIDALHPDAHFFVHIDKKSPIEQFDNLKDYDNVHFIDNRIDVRWGTINEAYYQMVLIDAVVNYVDRFDYIMFISGMDYPLWSNEQVTSFLEKNKGKEFIQGMCVDNVETGRQQREGYAEIRPFVNLPMIGNKWNTKLSILLRKMIHALGIKKKLFFYVNGKKWSLYKGSSWWCITDDLARYILEQYNQYPQIERYFHNQFGPAETLHQTIAFNSPQFAEKCILTTGEYKGLLSLTPLHHIDYSNGIKVWTESDYKELMESGKMFARKFRTGASDKVLDMIDKQEMNSRSFKEKYLKVNILEGIPQAFLFLFYVVFLQTLCYVVEGETVKHILPYFSAFYIEMLVIAALSVFLPRGGAKLLLEGVKALLSVMAIVDVYCHMRLGVVFGPTMVMLISETSKNEATEFVDTYLKQIDTLKVVGLFVAFSLSYSVIKYSFRRLLGLISKEKRRLVCIFEVAFVSCILVFALLNVGRTFQQRAEMWKIDDPGVLERDMSDAYFGSRCTIEFRFLASFYVHSLTNKEVLQIEKNVDACVVDSCSFKSPVIVLVIGESHNRSHSSLYGYEKKTTPLQDSLARRGELIRFTDVVSPWNMTSYAFKNMFSLHSIDQPGAWCTTTLFPALMRKAGYHVDFITNQFAMEKDLDVHDFSGGFFLNSQKLNKAMFDCRNPKRYDYDESLLTYYDSLSCHESANRLVMFHLSGQHFSYSKRYPSKFRRFKKEDYNRPDIKNQKNVRVVAMYDNATLYNDFILASIIKRFAKDDAVVIYLPDHGEECFDELQRFARSLWTDVSAPIARQEFRIPFEVWCSKTYRRNHPDIVKQIKSASAKPFMTDDLPHILLGLAGVSSPVYDARRDLFSDRFDASRHRLLKGTIDYDSLMTNEHKETKIKK